MSLEWKLNKISKTTSEIYFKSTRGTPITDEIFKDVKEMLLDSNKEHFDSNQSTPESPDISPNNGNNMFSSENYKKDTLLKAIELDNADALLYFKKYGEEMNHIFKNLKEAQNSVFYVRKNVIQEPLHKLESQLSQLSVDLSWMRISSLGIVDCIEHLVLNKSSTNSEIHRKLSTFSQRALDAADKTKKLIEEVQDISLMVETRKRYNSFKHSTDYSSLFDTVHPRSTQEENNVYPNSKQKVKKTEEESVGSDDEYDNEHKRKEKCSRCKQKTFGDIRYLKISCFYNMEELDIKELKFDKEHQEYVLAICKDCRHDFMFNALQSWFYKPRDKITVQNMQIHRSQFDNFVKEFSQI